MRIDEANADAEKCLPIHKPHDLFVTGDIGALQAPQQIQNEIVAGQTSQRQLPDHEGMRQHCSLLQQRGQNPSRRRK